MEYITLLFFAANNFAAVRSMVSRLRVGGVGCILNFKQPTAATHPWVTIWGLMLL